MALDSRQKRAAVVGVARPWYRNATPATIDDSKRAAVGNVYPIGFFQGLVTVSNSARHTIKVQARRFIKWVR